MSTFYIGSIPCSDNDLRHYGIKGMKWGVRKEEDYHSDYSKEQRDRDKAVYGRGGVKRINKNMKKGDKISTARSKEADRINNARKSARVAGQVGATVGAIGGAIGGYYASKYLTRALGTKISAFNDPAVRMATSFAISAGASRVATQLGRYGGQSAAMVVRGYSPKKYR